MLCRVCRSHQGGARLEPKSAPTQTVTSHSLSLKEVLSAAGLSLFVGIAAFIVFATRRIPWEDAAILFRYSENVAAGHGIVYNPGGEAVDGATDLLFMLALAGFNALGMRVELAAALINAASIAIITFLAYYCWRRWGGCSVGVALVPVAAVLVGPVWQYGQFGFGTPTFAAACTATAAASEWAATRPSRRNLVALGALVALAGLVRPEGFILGPLVTAAQAWRTRSPRLLMLPALVWFPTVAVLVGWRTLYFGYPLPNPFYKKGGGELHLEALRSMAEFMASTGLPVVVGLAVGLAIPASRRRAVCLSLVLAGWAASWLLMSDEMNLSYRFQFSILPVLVVLCAPLYAEMRRGSEHAPALLSRVSFALLVTFTAVGSGWSAQAFLRPAVRSFVHQVSDPEEARRASPQAQVAAVMRANANGALRTVVTTEAGYVAWKSGWTVTDLWGLNDKRIAHQGYLGVAGLVQLRPELVFCACSDKQSSGQFCGVCLDVPARLDPDDGTASLLRPSTALCPAGSVGRLRELCGLGPTRPP